MSGTRGFARPVLFRLYVGPGGAGPRMPRADPVAARANKPRNLAEARS